MVGQGVGGFVVTLARQGCGGAGLTAHGGQDGGRALVEGRDLGHAASIHGLKNFCSDG